MPTALTDHESPGALPKYHRRQSARQTWRFKNCVDTLLDRVGMGAIMWHERKMPARWYELLRERMQVEEQRMRVIKDGFVIKDDRLQELLTDAHNLDREMLQVMRQTIAEALAPGEVPRPHAA